MFAGVREQAAQPHAGHAEDLGKRAADEQVRDALDLGERGDAGEFVIGFVDQHGGLPCARARMRSIASSPMPVPVGLLGLAIRMARVSGVMASSTSCERELHRRAAGSRFRGSWRRRPRQ